MGILKFVYNMIKEEFDYRRELSESYVETHAEKCQKSERDLIGDKEETLQTVLDNPNASIEEKQTAYLAIRDEEERKLNAAYDFNSIEGIQSIPVPCKEVNGSSSTGRVEYYLRGKCAADHWAAGKTELALACLYKAQELMYISDMIWKRRDFIRLVEYLHKAGKHEDADRELSKIDKFFAQQDIHRDMVWRNIESAKYLDTDLMEVYSHSPYCGECAKYINRVYSISGQNKRFPVLPKQFLDANDKHHLSCLSLSPFIEGVNEPVFHCKDIAKYSRRPFADERTKEEIQRYNDWFSMMQEDARKQAAQEARAIENAKLEQQDLQTLEWLRENLPALCPKSLSGFRRMRTTNSKNYQALVKKAEAAGFVFPETLEDVAD